ncbi:MAG: GTP pyrophosphokinase family protein [Clostridiales bacterium]|nr:GTP pyrophosphokinase family protein [Clostridiales bacterium]
MEAENSIYGGRYPEMEAVMNSLAEDIRAAAKTVKENTGMNPVEHLKYRIKTEESMREKCRRHGIPETEESALETIHDAIGLRVVCTFLDDVFAIRDYLFSLPDLEVVNEKDYIRDVKPNGYRSLHLIVRKNGYYAEIQIRTISMDTWAALEHQIRYKKNVGKSALIFDELKRCADELASTDVSMQIIRAAINEKDDRS